MELDQRDWNGGRKEQCLWKAEGGLRERQNKQGSCVSSNALTKQRTTSAVKRTHQHTLRSQWDAWATRLWSASLPLCGRVVPAGCECAWRTLLLGLKCQEVNESGWKRSTDVCVVKLDRRWCHEGARREAARRTDGEEKESRLQVPPRSKEARAEEELMCIFKLQSPEERAGTVAGEAQTRSNNHDDVSIGHGRCMRSAGSAATTAGAECREPR